MTRPRLLLVAAVLGLSACRTPAKAKADAGHAAAPPTFPETGVVVFQPTGHPAVPVKVELAYTEAQHERGLMFRKHLEEGHGMLFVFKTDDDRTFWMKNTLIPLDMVFIGHDHRVVGIVHDAAPLTLSARDVGVPSRYVVEVPGGFTRAMGITKGTLVTFQGVPAHP